MFRISPVTFCVDAIWMLLVLCPQCFVCGVRSYAPILLVPPITSWFSRQYDGIGCDRLKKFRNRNIRQEPNNWICDVVSFLDQEQNRPFKGSFRLPYVNKSSKFHPILSEFRIKPYFPWSLREPEIRNKKGNFKKSLSSGLARQHTNSPSENWTRPSILWPVMSELQIKASNSHPAFPKNFEKFVRIRVCPLPG